MTIQEAQEAYEYRHIITVIRDGRVIGWKTETGGWRNGKEKSIEP